MNRYIIVGNQIDNWVLKIPFQEVINGTVKDAVYIEPYCFDNVLRKKYFEEYSDENRPHLKKYNNAKWRRWSSLKDLKISDDETVFLFFVYGRDVERLFDGILLKALKQKYANRLKTILLLFDSIDVTKDKYNWGEVTQIFPYFDVVSTYDEYDAEKYNLVHFHTPYNIESLPPVNSTIDLYFIGDEKGRGKCIEEIADKANENEVSLSINVFGYNGTSNNINVLKHFKPYNLVLNDIAACNCILEVVADGQNSGSLRFYEAISYNKKLLTNNKAVISNPYYKPEYIQVFDDADSIDYDWIKKDIEVDYDYKGEYSISKMIEETVTIVEKKNLRIPETDPLVSVIIPVYNRETTIARSINSVLNQTYTNLEVIVVDDGSTDNTLSVVNSIEDSRIKIISQTNKGACVARNVGIDVSNGEYIAFQDSDDEWHEDKLEKQVDILKNKIEYDIAFCNASRYDLEDGESKLLVFGLREGRIDENILIGSSKVSTQTILARKEVFEEDKFDPQMPRLQDYDLTIRLAQKHNFYYMENPLVDMYVQPDSISTDPKKSIVARNLLVNKYPDLYMHNYELYKSTIMSIRSNYAYMNETDNWAEVNYQYCKEIDKLNRGLNVLRNTIKTAEIEKNKTLELLKKERKEKEELAYCLSETRKSFSYKLGLFMTFIPRKIRCLFNKNYH